MNARSNRVALALCLLAAMLFVGWSSSDSFAQEDEDNFIDRDRSKLTKTQQKVRALEILQKGGWKGDITKAIRMAEQDAHFEVLEAIRGRKTAWGLELRQVLDKHLPIQEVTEELASKLTAKLVKGVRIIGYDADASGTVYAFAKFRVVDVARSFVKAKDWDRLAYYVKAVTTKYPRDIEVVGQGSLMKKRAGSDESESRKPPQELEEEQPGPFPKDWIERWRKAKKKMGDDFDDMQKNMALDIAKLHLQKNLILELKGMMDLEEYNYLSSYCKPEHLRASFTIGQVTGVRYTDVYGLAGGFVVVGGKIRLRDFVTTIRTVNKLETLTREKIKMLETRDREVVASGEASCDPETRKQTEPVWEPIGEVR